MLFKILLKVRRKKLNINKFRVNIDTFTCIFFWLHKNTSLLTYCEIKTKMSLVIAAHRHLQNCLSKCNFEFHKTHLNSTFEFK